MTELPVPDVDGRAHAERVAQRVHTAIDEAGGFLAFRDYMDLVLYAPGLGYYAAGAAKLGAAGDFTTAPELSPLFGAALARQIAAILAVTPGREILELGAGSGALAAQILEALARLDALPSSYRILEVSPDLQARQHERLAALPGDLGRRVEWLARLPERIDGAVVANEVLDAVPAHLVVRRDGRWHARGLCRAGEMRPPHFGLAWSERAADGETALLAAARLPDLDDYLSEINPAAEALVATLGERLVHGAALFIDYGFPAREYYHPQRGMGTVMCHYRHYAHGDPLFYPGLCDITAHVDFTAMAHAGERSGLAVEGYAEQAPFLMGCGVLDLLATAGAPDSVAYMKAAAGVQRLLSPAEMGELFKVLALARSPDIEWPGFALVNRRRRL